MNARTAAADTTLYRIDLRDCGDTTPDPRAQLAEHAASADESAALRAKLDAMDARSSHGAWTQRVLGMIAKSPGTRAGDLAARIGWDTATFKQHVRKLKALGLTESLEVGYQLSTRQLVREKVRLNNITVSPSLEASTIFRFSISTNIEVGPDDGKTSANTLHPRTERRPGGANAAASPYRRCISTKRRV